MDNPTIFNRATEAWTRYKELLTPADVGVRFSNGKILLFQRIVLRQIKFFSELFDSGLELPIIDGTPIVLDIDESKNYINETVFLFFCDKLKEQLYDDIFDAFIINTPIPSKTELDTPIDQLNYIKLLDYLTDPNERENLTENIKWCDLFWMGILEEKISNLKTFFDVAILLDAYNVCCLLVPEAIENDKNKLKKIFEITDADMVPQLVPLNYNYIPSNVTHLTFGPKYIPSRQ